MSSYKIREWLLTRCMWCTDTTSTSLARKNATRTHPTTSEPVSKRHSRKRLDVDRSGTLGPLWTYHYVNTWNNTGNPEFWFCVSMLSILRKFEELYDSISEAILPIITNISGCQPPCFYLEYRPNDDQLSLGVSVLLHHLGWWIHFFRIPMGTLALSCGTCLQT